MLYGERGIRRKSSTGKIEIAKILPLRLASMGVYGLLQKNILNKPVAISMKYKTYNHLLLIWRRVRCPHFRSHVFAMLLIFLKVIKNIIRGNKYWREKNWGSAYTKGLSWWEIKRNMRTSWSMKDFYISHPTA